MKLHTDTWPSQTGYRSFALTSLLTVLVLGVFLASCVQTENLWPAPKLGVVVDESMKVTDLDADGPAEKVGIQKGDILVSINGIPFTEKEKADAVIQEFPGEEVYEALAKGEEWRGKVFPLVFERNGEKIEVQIMPGPLNWWKPGAEPTPMNPEEPLDYL